jgi:cyclopropane fatty-acyl-phospholipid synthase-like methyltransferase
MKNYNEAEKHILLAIEGLERQKKPVTLEGIRDFEGWTTWKKDFQSLNDGLDRLVDRGLVNRIENIISLTHEGCKLAKQLEGQGFGKWMIDMAQSQAYRKFCLKVFGADRCQFDMMTQKQFEKLLEVLGSKKGDKVLDLGCGIGSISEAISDITGANVLGIDLSAEAIQFAQERTKGKKDRLTFQVMDMDDLILKPNQFDAVVVVDSLYFARDQHRTICAIKECLQDQGQMEIFFTTHVPADAPIEMIRPDGTLLVKILRDCGLSFETWDYTQDEKEMWERSLEAADELREEFEAECNPGIIEDRVSEAKAILELFANGRNSRYLYRVIKK